MKKILCFSMLSLLSACSSVSTNQVKAPVPTNSVNTQTANSSVNNEVKLTQLTKEELENQQDVFVAEVSKEKGGSFGVSINLKDAPAFNVKNNIDGSVGGSSVTAIAKVDVYLLKLPTSFAAGGDPLGTANANVATSFTGASGLVKSGANFNILFKNVPGLATNKYWVGIIAKDASGNILNKAPTTAWTGQTLSTAPNLALSSSGVGVSTTTLAVDTPTNLTVALTLGDTVGAQISTDVTATAGTGLPGTITAS